MTDEEKNLIKKEILTAYWQLSKIDNIKRYAMAINIGLNRAQRILNEKRSD